MRSFARAAAAVFDRGFGVYDLTQCGDHIYSQIRAADEREAHMARFPRIESSDNEHSTGLALDDVHVLVDKIAAKIGLENAKRGDMYPTDDPEDFVAEFEQASQSLKRGLDHATNVSTSLVVWYWKHHDHGQWQLLQYNPYALAPIILLAHGYALPHIS